MLISVYYLFKINILMSLFRTVIFFNNSHPLIQESYCVYPTGKERERGEGETRQKIVFLDTETSKILKWTLGSLHFDTNSISLLHPLSLSLIHSVV